jgi:hypothetical protein
VERLAEEVAAPRVHVAVFGEGESVVGAAHHLHTCEGKRAWEGDDVDLSNASVENGSDAHRQGGVVAAVRKPQLPALVAAAQIQLTCKKKRRRGTVMRSKDAVEHARIPCRVRRAEWAPPADSEATGGFRTTRWG